MLAEFVGTTDPISVSTLALIKLLREAHGAATLPLFQAELVGGEVLHGMPEKQHDISVREAADCQRRSRADETATSAPNECA